MADISTITLPNGTTYTLKDTAGRNTQNLVRPSSLRGLNDVTLQSLVNTTRANRLAFLPADQIIIEKTTDGGTTWVDAGISDATKAGLFAETRAAVSIPLLNGVKSMLCGLRITITAMKYNVPSGTAETAKYNYWNSNYVSYSERYNQLKEMYFWLSATGDTIGVKVERATGANSTNWYTIFNDTSFLMTGWAGCNYLRFSQSNFGGGQTTNYWNYRLTFMTKGTLASNGTTMATTYTDAAQSLIEIRAYGDTWWTAGNEYAANDKIYTHDYQQSVTFPNKVTANGGFVGNLNGTAGKADWATNLLSYSGNEVTIGGSTGTAANDTVWINYRDKNGGSVSSEATQITTYNFGNRKGNTNGVTVKAETFNGNLTGNVTGDVSGKVNNHTVNADVPSGAKFTDTTYTANTSKLVTTTVPNVTSVGSAPTLGTAIAADDITAWTTNTPTAFSVSGEKLTITTGTAASLSYTEKSIPNVTSVGSAPTLGTAVTVATGSLAANGSGASVATGITAS